MPSDPTPQQHSAAQLVKAIVSGDFTADQVDVLKKGHEAGHTFERVEKSLDYGWRARCGKCQYGYTWDVRRVEGWPKCRLT